MEEPVLGPTRRGPLLTLELMDGDGHVKGGRGVGTVSFAYDFDDNRVAVAATGTTSPILQNVARSAAANDVEFLVSRKGRLIVEKQLQACQVDESGR